MKNRIYLLLLNFILASCCSLVSPLICMESLVDSDSNAEQDEQELTQEQLLFAACNAIDLIRELIKEGASANAVDNLCNTPLHSVAQTGTAPVASLLIDKGARLEARNILGQTPLQVAVQYNNTAVVTVLLNRGAAVGTKNYAGATPLHTAVQEHNCNIARMLMAHHANPHAADIKGKTPLGIAIANNNLRMQRILQNMPEEPTPSKQKQSLLLPLTFSALASGCLGFLIGYKMSQKQEQQDQEITNQAIKDEEVEINQIAEALASNQLTTLPNEGSYRSTEKIG